MLTVNAENFTLEPTREARMALTVPEEADSVKAFVLDASTLSPLRPAWEWENAASEPAGNVLVSYFSATGSTKRIAAQIAGILDADLYEITPAVPYTSADLNYGDRSTRATVELKSIPDGFRQDWMAERLPDFDYMRESDLTLARYLYDGGLRDNSVSGKYNSCHKIVQKELETSLRNVSGSVFQFSCKPVLPMLMLLKRCHHALSS